MAANIVADLRAVLPAREFGLEPVVDPERVRTTLGSPLLYSPRCRAALSPAARADPRRVEIRYLIDSNDLETLGEELAWSPARHAAALRSKPRPASAAST